MSDESPESTAPHGYSPNKDNYAKRLRRIEGQVRGIAKMIEDDKYCIDVLTQISAANNALRSVALNLLDEHLGHCVSRAVAAGGTAADEKLAGASAARARLVVSLRLTRYAHRMVEYVAWGQPVPTEQRDPPVF